jgi:hypothetical protein
MNRAELDQWRAERDRKDVILYEQFGRPLEPAHNGEFVAISDDGRTILGSEELDVTDRAIEQFGSGNFALRRIGARAEVRVLTSRE